MPAFSIQGRRPGAAAAPADPYPLLAERVRPWLSWAVLGMLLLATCVAAATLDRRQWPGLIGDEAAYLMQAESLAWDLDLRYTRADYDRFVAHWQRRPEGLILQSGDGGETLTYGKPALYSLWLAPFVRLAPVHGPAVANALLLALAALAAAAALRGPVGAAAPLWVAALVFASVTFANVFWAHADLFLACLTALALALVYRPAPALLPGEGPAGSLAPALRWAVAGALLAAVILSRPLYAPLALPALWVAARRHGAGQGFRRPLAYLLAGAVLLSAAAVGSSWLVRGGWTPYGGERMGFYSYTGFPEVDLASGGWAAELEQRPGSGSWVEKRKLRFPIDPGLWAWDALYFSVGSHVGVVPYFLPGILLAVAALARRRYRPGAWPLLLAVGAVVAAFFVVRPFNFYGGGAALANRYFLPAYPALWFVLCGAAEDGEPADGLGSTRLRVWGAPLLAAVLAAPFIWPLWAAPTAYPLEPQGGWRYVSGWARELLPYETTLDHLKPAGREDLQHRSLWIKRLDPGVAGPAEGVDDGWLRLDPPRGELLVGSRQPIGRLVVETGAGGEALHFGRAEGVQRIAAGEGGGAGWEIRPARVARHRMWWSDEPVHLYRLELVSPVPVHFRLTPSDGDRARSSPPADRR